jgi:flagellar biosynthetic protein FliP
MRSTCPTTIRPTTTSPRWCAPLFLAALLIAVIVPVLPAQALPEIQPEVSAGESPAATGPSTAPGQQESGSIQQQLESFSQPGSILSSLRLLLLVTVMSMAPAVLLMTTCFVRIMIVLGLLRQALGAQNLPSNQVLASLALFITLLVMGPTWKQVYSQGIEPYSQGEVDLSTAWQQGKRPLVDFMGRQIDHAGNTDDVWLFYRHLPAVSISEGAAERPLPANYDEVPLQVLLPAFLMSELKIAFMVGFQVFLPFLVLDLVVATVTTSMGMLMLPPTMLSLPLKLMLFVLVDGWRLVVGMLLDGFSLVG